MPDDIENDGSLLAAAQNMPDFDAVEDPSPAATTQIIDPREANQRRRPVVDPSVVLPFQTQNRMANGQYAEGRKPVADGQPLRGHNEAPDDTPDPRQTDDGEVNSDAVEEFFELAPDKEGEAPRRIPAQEVFAGFQEAQQLRADLEQARRIAPPPMEWDKQMYETVQVRGQLVHLLNTISATILPSPPDQNLINRSSPAYDPDTYHHQVMVYQAAEQRLAHVQAAQRNQAALLEQEQGALKKAEKIREQGKLRDLWPEIADPAMQRRVRDYAAREFGITDHDFATIHDSRFYAMLKRAMAYDEAVSQRQAAVKVVRSVPKLVKAAARSAQSRGQAAYQSGMQRLQRSGSETDAADALGGLLNL